MFSFLGVLIVSAVRLISHVIMLYNIKYKMIFADIHDEFLLINRSKLTKEMSLLELHFAFRLCLDVKNKIGGGEGMGRKE